MDKTTLGEKLRALRELRGFRQEDIAQRFRTGKSTVSQWESNKRRPDYDTLVDLAKLYNTSVSYLLGETNDPHPPKQYRDEGLEARLPADLQVFLRGKGGLTDTDIKLIVDLYERLRREREEGES